MEKTEKLYTHKDIILPCSFLVQLFSILSKEELFSINEKLFEKIKEKYEEKIEILKEDLNKMTPSESYELKEDMKKDLMEEYKDNLKKEIRDLEEQLKTAPEDEKLSIEEELENKKNEALSYEPSFKENCFYMQCPDKTNTLEEQDYDNVFSVDNLNAHFMVEYSGKVVTANGQFVDGLNQKIFFYMTNSLYLNEKGAYLRNDLIVDFVPKYDDWKYNNEKYNKGNKRPVEYMFVFKGKNKYYYMLGYKFIELYNKDKTLKKYKLNECYEWYYIPLEYIKKYSYCSFDAPSYSKEDEKEAYKKLKSCRKPVKREDDSWEYITVNSEPNFDPDKINKKSFIRSRIHLSKYNVGKRQFFLTIYDANGEKINEKCGCVKSEIYFRCDKEFYEYIKKQFGYKKTLKTFSIDGYKEFINKPIKHKTKNGIDRIMYIQCSEDVDIEQDFSKTYLKNLDGQWYLLFKDEFAKKVLKAENEIFYVNNELFEKHVNKNYVISLIDAYIKAGGEIDDNELIPKESE